MTGAITTCGGIEGYGSGNVTVPLPAPLVSWSVMLPDWSKLATVKTPQAGDCGTRPSSARS